MAFGNQPTIDAEIASTAQSLGEGDRITLEKADWNDSEVVTFVRLTGSILVYTRDNQSGEFAADLENVVTLELA